MPRKQLYTHHDGRQVPLPYPCLRCPRCNLPALGAHRAFNFTWFTGPACTRRSVQLLLVAGTLPMYYQVRFTLFAAVRSMLIGNDRLLADIRKFIRH